MSRNGLGARALVTGIVTALVGLLVAAPAAAATTSSPPPWSKIFLGRDVPGINCTAPTGTVVYNGAAWTVAPAVRGPLFAPTVIWLADFAQQPVMPMQFTTTAGPIFWETADGGPHAEGTFDSVTGRPQGYGSVPTDPAPKITCVYYMLGHFDFGTYTMTAPLAAMLGVPGSLVGRKLHFDGEGTVSFVTPKYLFPTRVAARAPTFPTPDLDSYPAVNLPTVTCTNATTGKRVYQGPATTAAPLVRGFHWAPMAFWLRNDRMVTPRWFDTALNGTWQTVDGGPPDGGPLRMTEDFPPTAYLGQQDTLTIHCRYAGHDNSTFVATDPFLEEVGLGTRQDLVGRTIKVNLDWQVDAQAGTWLFPPTV